MRYQGPLDVVNRGLQHCGIPPIIDFTDDSRAALETFACYDKLRRSELERNVWGFATRKACIRAFTPGSDMRLRPELWGSSITYGFGAVVSMDDQTLWQSKTQDNVSNQPGNTPGAWELYCGPMSVLVYDTTGTTGYYPGEFVYQTPGDGTYAVYLSLVGNNSQDPRAPSEWAYGTQYSKDQVVLYYAAWSALTTYAAGNTVSYNGNNYVSLLAGNLNQNPGTASQYWAIISSSLAPGYYNSQTAYTAGIFVTYLGINYVCILAGTGQTPSTSPTYWLAQAAGTFYVSLIDFNLNNLPSASPLPWVQSTTYATGNQVAGSDGQIYTSLKNSNTGNDPMLTAGTDWTPTGVLAPWTTTDYFGNANNSWIQVAVAITDMLVIQPISTPGGASPFQYFQRSLFLKPANYIRMAPQDPQQGGTNWLGAPTNLGVTDWEIDGEYITSQQNTPIVLRFVADNTDVNRWDSLFCEALAARIGMEVCEALTGSTAKLQAIGIQYKLQTDRAAVINGIETGPTEPPLDGWIQCRI